MRDSTRSAELTALTEIAAQVNCTQDLDEILSGALATTLQVVGADAGEVFLFDEETGELLLHAQQGLSEAFLLEEAVLGPAECLCGLSAASRSLVIAEDIASHPARSRAACLREGFRSLLCLPLLVRGQVVGLLNVQCRAPRQFTAEDEELLTAIGNQILYRAAIFGHLLSRFGCRYASRFKGPLSRTALSSRSIAAKCFRQALPDVNVPGTQAKGNISFRGA